MKQVYGDRSDRELKLVVVMIRSVRALSTSVAPDFREAGLTEPQFGVMEALYHIGPMTVNQIITKSLSSSGNMGVVIDNLIKANLAVKQVDLADRRIRRVSLTEIGTKLIRDLFPKHLETLADFMEVLTNEEMNQLTTLLKKLGKGRKNRRRTRMPTSL